MSYDRLSYTQLATESNRTPLEHLQAAEIERLKGIIEDGNIWYERVKLESTNLRARVEELSKMWNESFKHANSLSEDKDILKARLIELERLLSVDMSQLGQSIVALKFERDTLRARVEEQDTLIKKLIGPQGHAQEYVSIGKFEHVRKERDTLKQRVEELEGWSIVEKYDDLVKERDTLKQRVRELVEEQESLHSEADMLLASASRKDAILEEYADVNRALRAECRAVKISRQISEDTATRVIEGLRAELEQIKDKIMQDRLDVYDDGCAYIEELTRDNLRLKAELAATKAVPDVEVRMLNYVWQDTSLDLFPAYAGEEKLKLTFTDGKLTGAEVVG